MQKQRRGFSHQNSANVCCVLGCQNHWNSSSCYSWTVHATACGVLFAWHAKSSSAVLPYLPIQEPLGEPIPPSPRQNLKQFPKSISVFFYFQAQCTLDLASNFHVSNLMRLPSDFLSSDESTPQYAGQQPAWLSLGLRGKSKFKRKVRYKGLSETGFATKDAFDCQIKQSNPLRKSL